MRKRNNIPNCRHACLSIAVLAVFVFSALLPAAAQSRLAECDTLKVSVFFHSASPVIEPDYADNGANLDNFVRRIVTTPGCRIKAMRIVGHTSPDGSSEFNRQLSIDRAESVLAWLASRLPMDGVKLSVEGQGIDWSGLRAAVEASSMPARAQVLEILDGPEYYFDRNGKVVNSRKKRLMDLNCGRTWAWMKDNIYPKLRRASSDVTCIVEIEAPQPQPEPKQPVAEQAADEPPEYVQPPMPVEATVTTDESASWT